MKNISKIHQLLQDAYDHTYAIGGFNYDNATILRGIIAAAETTKQHVFVMCTQSASFGMGYDFALNNALTAAKLSPYIISHWDHGFDYELVNKVIHDGWNSVMYDGSRLDFATNLKNTAAFIKHAEKLDVYTECELGIVGGKEDDIHTNEKLTDPDKAIQFAYGVKARMIGIAVGNKHGVYQSTPNLNFDLIRTVSSQLPEHSFLVLHGGSGIPDDQIKHAIKCGIAKVNVGTDLKIAYANIARNWFDQNPKGFDTKKYHNSAIEAVKEVVIKKIKLLNSLRKK